MDRRILFILIMSLAVPYGCSMALLGTSLAKSGGLKEQEALSAAWASDSRENGLFAESAWTWKIHRKNGRSGNVSSHCGGRTDFGRVSSGGDKSPDHFGKDLYLPSDGTDGS